MARRKSSNQIARQEIRLLNEYPNITDARRRRVHRASMEYRIRISGQPAYARDVNAGGYPQAWERQYSRATYMGLNEG